MNNKSNINYYFVGIFIIFITKLFFFKQKCDPLKILHRLSVINKYIFRMHAHHPLISCSYVFNIERCIAAYGRRITIMFLL